MADPNPTTGDTAPEQPGRPSGMSALLKRLFAAAPSTPGERRAPRPGANIGRFELVREVGRGGFGVVFEARDLELGRTVALKVLCADASPCADDERLLGEAEAAARLSHPNVVTIHDVGRSEWGPYLVLELLRGETLERRLRLGPLPLRAALRVAEGVASGLAHAHERGVVHRDVTPKNVFLCDDGQVKLLDLGLAHAFGHRRLDGGTPAYMAPEQWSGAPEDERTDVFALGVVLFRMLTGALPFPDEGARSTRARRPVRSLEVAEEPELGRFVSRMLERDPLRRPRDAGEVLGALRSFERDLQQTGPGAAPSRPSEAAARRRARRRASLVALAVVAACAVFAWYAHREARIRWALQTALPRAVALAEQGKYPAALALATDVERIVPGDPRLRELWPEISRLVTIETVPTGARVLIRAYSDAAGAWRDLGRSPVLRVRLPLVMHRLRLEKEGFAPIEVMPRQPFFEIGRVPVPASEVVTLRFALDRAADVPPGMVHVPGGEVRVELWGLEQIPPVAIRDYLIDRTEVTNREYKAFVDAGGYGRRELWRHPFVKDGRTLSWEQGIALLRDRTGRPGPATWVSGEYPEGQGELPVTGVSWYEAAAYAAFVGKALPNVHQWSHAAGLWAAAEILPLSNFGEKGLAPVGRSEAIGPFGTLDMAGNAKEWCWNEADAGRFLLGGAWNEPPYMFNLPDAQSPLARGANYGFRLVKQLDGETDAAASAPIHWAANDRELLRPVAPEVYQAFRRIYAYDDTPLNAAVEVVDDSSERWRKERVTFDAAYGGERVIAYVFTPRRGAPPFETVVFFPGSNAILAKTSDRLTLMRMVAPILSSGRAVVYPVYKSTYERRDGLATTLAAPTAFYRDHVIAWSRDLGRTIDYIQTRRDLDGGRIALYGVSWGAKLLPLLAAVEDRIRVGIMVSGGRRRLDALMPETDPINFAPYLRKPVLMVNGRYDFLFPVETSQRPLFDLLGAPPVDKRHVIFDSGHVPPNDLLTKEVLDWLDRQLGPTR